MFREHSHSGGVDGSVVHYKALPIRPGMFINDDWGDDRISSRVQRSDRYRPEWQAVNGSWQASGGELRETTITANWAEIQTPSSFTVGSWVVRGSLGNTGSNNDLALRFMYIDSQNFYQLQLGGTGNFILVKVVGGSAYQIISDPWTVDTNWHVMKVTRDEDGNFDIYLDGTSRGSTQDTTFSTSNYMRFAIVQSSTASPTRIDYVKVY